MKTHGRAAQFGGSVESMFARPVGRAALLANKRATGRAKDAADVEALEALVEPDLG